MDDDSVNFGSDAAGATPGSILAHPPLEGTPREGSSGKKDEVYTYLCRASSGRLMSYRRRCDDG